MAQLKEPIDKIPKDEPIDTIPKDEATDFEDLWLSVETKDEPIDKVPKDEATEFGDFGDLCLSVEPNIGCHPSFNTGKKNNYNYNNWFFLKKS